MSNFKGCRAKEKEEGKSWIYFNGTMFCVVVVVM
jgi:hypothetical protein